MDTKKNLVQEELTLDELKKIVFQAKNMGVKKILVLGGEPLVYKNIFKLLEFCHKQRMETTLITNGLLINNNIEKLVGKDILHVHISLDGATAKTHNKIRGKGVFEKVMKNIDVLNKYKKMHNTNNPSISTTFTIIKHNFHEIPEIVSLAEKKGFSSVNFQPVMNNTDPKNTILNNELWISKNELEELDAVINKLIEIKNKKEYSSLVIENTVSNLNLIKKYFKGTLKFKDRPCYAGFNRLHATQIGTGYLCDESFGDIRKQSLKEIWYSKKAKKLRKNIKNCNTPCMQFCAYRTEFDALENHIRTIL